MRELISAILGLFLGAFVSVVVIACSCASMQYSANGRLKKQREDAARQSLARFDYALIEMRLDAGIDPVEGYPYKMDMSEMFE